MSTGYDTNPITLTSMNTKCPCTNPYLREPGPLAADRFSEYYLTHPNHLLRAHHSYPLTLQPMSNTSERRTRVEDTDTPVRYISESEWEVIDIPGSSTMHCATSSFNASVVLQFHGESDSCFNSSKCRQTASSCTAIGTGITVNGPFDSDTGALARCLLNGEDMQARSDPPTFCSQTGLANETRTLEVIPLGGGLCVDFFIIDLSSESEPSNTSRPSPFPTSKTLDPNVEQTQSRTDQAQVIGGAVGGTIAAILIGVIAGLWIVRKRRTRVVLLESTSHSIHPSACLFKSLMILCRRKSCGYKFGRARTA